jgi:hypothetical protein
MEVTGDLLQNNIEIFAFLHESLIFYDVGMLRRKWSSVDRCRESKGTDIQIFE